jgi:hypothetical protein
MNGFNNLNNLNTLNYSSDNNFWSPSFLGSDLQFWVDALETSSITLNGATVSQWNDLSGNNRHLTQSTGSLQPLYITSGAGSVGVGMDGLDDVMSSPTFAINQPFTRFLVVTRRDASTAGTIINSISGTPNSPLGNSSTSTTKVAMFGGINNLISGQDTINGQRSQFGTIYNGASSELWNNGTSTSGVNIGTNGMSGVRIGGGNPSPYVFHSVLIINRIPTTDERERMEGYLAWRYGIQSSLPANHPFIASPPSV